MNKITELEWLKKTLGPGILFASTAIGVSHLVQSTRAGASYGFGLLFFMHLSRDLKFNILHCFLDLKIRLSFLFFSFKTEANLPSPPVTNIFFLIYKIFA